MILEILFSAVVALAGTIFIIYGSMAGNESKKSIVIIGLVSFLMYFTVSYYFDLPLLVLSLI
jgi:hypothetical protein